MAPRITLLAALLAAYAIGQVPITEAEAVKKLTGSLVALKDGGSALNSHGTKITEDILNVSEEHHRPSRLAVAMFANGLMNAVQGKQISDTQLSQLATAIVAVMRSAGVATFKLLQSLSRAETVLRSAGVNQNIAKSVSAQLGAIGKEVRGPEDVPVQTP